MSETEQVMFMVTDKPIISLKHEQLKPHKLNMDIFGNLSDNEYNDFKQDIQKRGIQDPLHVVKQNGGYVVVSGHQRLRVATELDIDLPCIVRTDLKEEWQVEEQLIKDNLLRRQLNDYHKKKAVDRLKSVYEVKAKESQKEAGKQYGVGHPKKEEVVSEMTPALKNVEVKSKSRDKALDDVGMSVGQYVNATKIENHAPEPIRKKWQTGEISTGTAIREMKKEEKKQQIEEMQIEKKIELSQPAEIKDKKYNVILADPPWRYDFQISKSRMIENHYPTMEVEDICNLKIPCDEDSILFLWATAPKLLEAIQVMQRWGFKYKTNGVWDKQKIGQGYYFRGQHELLLIGTKGNMTPPLPENRRSSVISVARTEHSKKPECVYSMIEKMYPHGVYIELFARHKHSDKWGVWGNEV